jgi:hypothetical protein
MSVHTQHRLLLVALAELLPADHGDADVHRAAVRAAKEVLLMECSGRRSAALL